MKTRKKIFLIALVILAPLLSVIWANVEARKLAESQMNIMRLENEINRCKQY